MVSPIGVGADVSQLANATVRAAVAGYQLSALDPPLQHALWLLARLPCAASNSLRAAVGSMFALLVLLHLHSEKVTLISELGTDFTKWPTVKHFASWLGLCPNFKKTGGKVKSSATRKGKNRAATALRLAAWSLMRSKSYLGAYLRRQRSRLGAPKAITATAHKLARILYNLMRYGVEYMRKTEAEYAEQEHARQEKGFHRRAKELGYEVHRPPATEAEPIPESTVA